MKEAEVLLAEIEERWEVVDVNEDYSETHKWKLKSKKRKAPSSAAVSDSNSSSSSSSSLPKRDERLKGLWHSSSDDCSD